MCQYQATVSRTRVIFCWFSFPICSLDEAEYRPRPRLSARREPPGNQEQPGPSTSERKTYDMFSSQPVTTAQRLPN